MSRFFNGDQLRVKPDPADNAAELKRDGIAPAERSVLHDLLEEEAALRQAKVQTLRQARLDRDAKAARLAAPKPARKLRVPPRFAN